MTMQEISPAAIPAGSATAADGAARPEAGSLFHPVIDFLCLGGGSLILFALLAAFRPPVESYPAVAVVMLALANIVNHPHFAHSYQIFYRGFGEKAFGSHYERNLRLRYLFAGIVVPILLFAYFASVILLENLVALGLAVNLMLFLVGWHYVKQGYGMLIVCSVLKRQFFNESEKKVLLANAYAVWIADWMIANWTVYQRDMWGLAYYTFDLPEPLVLLATAIAVGTTAATLWMLGRKWWAADRRLPVNGVVAYLVTLYAWLLLNVDPLFVLVIPACHSLQYLLVVWRYQLNADRARAREAQSSGGRRLTANVAARFASFLLTGLVVGYVGFWGLPRLLGSTLPVDESLFGSTLFVFVCWIFINTHHYFLDNVMWRRGNPDTGRYLFSHR